MKYLFFTNNERGLTDAAISLSHLTFRAFTAVVVLFSRIDEGAVWLHEDGRCGRSIAAEQKVRMWSFRTINRLQSYTVSDSAKESTPKAKLVTREVLNKYGLNLNFRPET